MENDLITADCRVWAVSGVSLVNQFNTIFIYLFTALASGGAVVISQYIGRQEPEHAGESASQLFLFSAVFSILIGVAVLLGNEAMLRLLFRKVESLSGNQIIKTRLETEAQIWGKMENSLYSVFMSPFTHGI